jgi:tetratricopeptide (TPR) repeat protein
VGRIVSYGTDSSARAMAGPVSDLLATSLARAPGLRVVSPGRMLALMRNPAPGDTGAGAFDAAAHRAGATEIIDGTLYLKPSRGLRLDLRRVDLSTGAIDGVFTIEGEDLFSLVDSGTARLVASLGSNVPAGSVADVMTHSVHAYRLYEEGIKAWFVNDPPNALRLFDAAVAADSTFALATYYGAIASVLVSGDSLIPRIKRAKLLAARAPDRERLTILADWADRTSSPSMRQYAETLATRYPTEIEGHLYTGIALVLDGEFLQALTPLQRVVSMDSLGARPQAMTCGLCAAMQWLNSAYILADSLPAAEREARRWMRLQPNSPNAVNYLVEVLELEGRDAEADSVYRAGRPDLSFDDAIAHHAAHLLRVGAYAEADSLFLIRARQGGRQTQMDGLWTLALSQREQGRLTDALATVRRTRPLGRSMLNEDPPSTSILEAQIQLEAGHPRVAAALFDSVMWLPLPRHEQTQVARHRAWMLTQVAGARAAAGDTGVLARLADSVQALGAVSGYGRDRRLHHYVRGLLLAARRRDADAIDEFQKSIYSTTMGYTRSNYEMATLYLRGGRAREAVAILQPALRGDLQSQNLYVNRVEIHALLAKAWDLAGNRDSAAAHYRVVARAWAAGDPPFRVRADSARARAR